MGCFFYCVICLCAGIRLVSLSFYTFISASTTAPTPAKSCLFTLTLILARAFGAILANLVFGCSVVRLFGRCVLLRTEIRCTCTHTENVWW